MNDEIGRLHEEGPNPHECQERQQLRRAGDHDEPRSLLDAARIDVGEEGEHHEQHRHPERGHAEQRADPFGKCRRHARHGGSAQHPQQHAGHRADIAPEHRFHVRVGTARHRDAATGFCKAEHDAADDGGADEVHEGCRRTSGCRGACRQTEDAAADGDVEDAGGEPQNADRADEFSSAR